MLYTLKASGLEGEGCPTSESFWKALDKKLPDLVMLDIMLPGEDGLEILTKLRNNPKTAEVPVIMATAKGTEYDKVKGLDAGADDYLTKPFGMMEMVSRIKAVLRRSHITLGENNQLRFDGVVLDKIKHQVTVDGEIINIQLKEYELLQLFAENPGIVFSRDTLLNRIWSTDYLGESRTVDVHISSLRNRLGQWGKRIKTVRSVGYCLEA